VLAALRAGLVTSLVTDVELARRVISLERSRRPRSA